MHLDKYAGYDIVKSCKSFGMYETLCHNGSYSLFWKDKITKFWNFQQIISITLK